MMGQPMGDGTGSIEEMAARMKALAGNMQQGMPGGMAQTVGGDGLSMQPPPGMRSGVPGPYVNMDPEGRNRQAPPPPPPAPVNPGIPRAGNPPMPQANPFAAAEAERAKREYEMRKYGKLQGGN